MEKPSGVSFSRLPSVDEVLKATPAAVERFGRLATVNAIRKSLQSLRDALRADQLVCETPEEIGVQVQETLARQNQSKVRPVLNLTGTVLHTNLGRAQLAEAAVEAAAIAMRQALALEYDLESGRRGERDALIRDLLCELTGAEDATVVNNNAAAVLLIINTLAKGKEAIVSRGELIEIGGAFRMPDIMERAGAKLIEIGTTNRTHIKDYEEALTAKSGLVLKVHTSNYRIEGFVKEVPARELAGVARERGVPLVNDLGSGTLIDLSRYGLSHEPTVAEAVADGADLVSFSGDKLLGGPQAGFIVGRKNLIARLNKNPMKRALRIDKIRLAAVEATLRLYRDPDRLAQRLPTLRMLARPKEQIAALSTRILQPLSLAIGDHFTASVVDCWSQIGSGALPQETVASSGIACRARGAKGSGRALEALAAAFRDLPIPVIGRIADQSFILDLRCLEDEGAFLDNLAALKIGKV